MISVGHICQTTYKNIVYFTGKRFRDDLKSLLCCHTAQTVDEAASASTGTISTAIE